MIFSMFGGLRPSMAHRAAAMRFAEYYLDVLKRANTLAVKKGGSAPEAIALLELEWGIDTAILKCLGGSSRQARG